MKVKALLIALLLAARAHAGEITGPLYPVSVEPDGRYHIHRALPQPPAPFWLDWVEGIAEAAGFDLPMSTNGAYALDGSVCLTTGIFGGTTVPRCTNGDGKFYLAFGLPSTPASPPSFTLSFDINNSGGETTAGNHWCYRGSCASVSSAGSNSDTIAHLTFGTASTLSDNTFSSSCNAANAECIGSATAAFTCSNNAGSACSGTACNDHLLVIFAEPRKTSCTATTSTVSLDYGFAHLVEAN